MASGGSSSVVERLSVEQSGVGSIPISRPVRWQTVALFLCSLFSRVRFFVYLLFSWFFICLLYIT